MTGFDGGTPIDNTELLALDVDVLIPAAVEGVLDAEAAVARPSDPPTASGLPVVTAGMV